MRAIKDVGMRALLGACVIFYAGVASALTIKPIYESNLTSHPDAVAIKAGIGKAIQRYAAEYSNPITINIQIGWGSVLGSSCGNNLGVSGPRWSAGYTLGQALNFLGKTATSPEDTLSVNSIATASSIPSGNNYFLVRAQQKLFGLVSANDSVIDGYICFGANHTWTYDETLNGVAPGTFGLVGTAMHELSHVMGRQSALTRSGASSHAGIIDLFRFIAPDVRSFNAWESTYFSIDKGVTRLQNFDSGMDQISWINTPSDCFNEAAAAGVYASLTEVDLIEMDIIGYTRTKYSSAPVNPQPPTEVIAPEDPSNLTARVSSAGNPKKPSYRVDLSWVLPANVSQIRVYRSVNGGAMTLYTTINASTSYRDSGVSRGNTYSYQVRAVNTSGLQSPNGSNVVVVAISP